MLEKMKKKRGFSLIEMLLVVAVIAILVAIVIPTFGNSRDKSAAATNAANLRSIEGKIAAMRAEYPDAFDEFIAMGDQTEENASSGVGGWLDDVFNAGEGQSGSIRIVTADENNVITVVPSDTGAGYFTITDVPTSKAVTVGTDAVGEGEKMSVRITSTEITAYYGRYNKNDFADIAEDGEYNGNNNPKPCDCTDGSTSGDVFQSKCLNCGHSIGEHDTFISSACGGGEMYGKCNHID